MLRQEKERESVPVVQRNFAVEITCYSPFNLISGLWGLVNNAGIGIAGPIEWTPLEHMKHIADVNLWGMIDVTKTFLPLIKKSQGRVVNMSSLAGEV